MKTKQSARAIKLYYKIIMFMEIWYKLFFLEERFFFFEPIRTVKATTRFLERNGVYHLQTQQLVYAKFSLN